MKRYLDDPAALHRGLKPDQSFDLLERVFLDVLQARAPRFAAAFPQQAPVPAEDRALLLISLHTDAIWLTLLKIAEESAAMYQRRRREAEHGPETLPGTFAQVFHTAQDRGVSHATIQDLLSRARIRPVITAHPTEAKRITVLEIQRRIYLLLVKLESDRWVRRERAAFIVELRAEIDLLWLSGELRREKPSVAQEVEWGLHFFRESLFDRVPELLEKLDLALESAYPGEHFEIGPCFEFGSWIGGDRDGNPFVTVAGTRDALHRYRLASLKRYRMRLTDLCAKLSVAQHALDTVPTAFLDALPKLLKITGATDVAEERNPGEIFRQYSSALLARIEATLANSKEGADPGSLAYAQVDEFIEDLVVLHRGLVDSACPELAQDLLVPLIREVRIFRFRTVSLDLRQNTTVTTATLHAIWDLLTGMDEAQRPDKDSQQWKAWILEELARPLRSGAGSLDLNALDSQTVEQLELLRLAADVESSMDRQSCGGFVLSMTSSAVDVLGVYLLAKYAGLFSDHEGKESSRLLIIPLFETIEDLRAAPAIMLELLNVPVVKRTVRDLGGVQDVMIGYSDSNKDGGFVTANWELSLAQQQLTRVGAAQQVPIVFFHGRGGSVSRGGAPTGRAIAAQPAGSIAGRMHSTEQGEVVSLKFANRGTALYNMELLAASVFAHSLKSMGEEALKPHPEFDEVMEALSGISFAAYRGLVEHPGMVEYYAQASPVEELALLNIGSRPARRFGAGSLADLRAIPWVFAWTQSRQMVTGWYGLGTALQEFRKVRKDPGEAILKRMFDKSRLFRLIIDEAEKILAQVDLEIAREYASLVGDVAVRDAIFTMIESEYARTVEQVVWLSGEEALGSRFPGFQRRLVRRLPILKRVGLKQVALIRAHRGAGEDGAARREDLIPLLVSMNCIATGLGWTG